MIRPSREELLIETAFVWAKRSTCARLQVGAVVSRDGRVLVQGYNGAPAGLPHCNHDCNCESPWWQPKEHRLECASLSPCTLSVHAEQNAIAFAAKHGVALDGAELITTHQPCPSCAMSIINAGIERVLYVYPYRIEAGVEMMRQAGLVVEQYLDWEEPKVVESPS